MTLDVEDGAIGSTISLPPEEPLSAREQRVARRLFRSLPEQLVARRSFPLGPTHLVATMGRVLPHPPFDLQLWESSSGDLALGGTMLFRVRPWSGTPGLDDRFFFRWRLHAVFVAHLLVELRPEGENQDRSEVSISADLRKELRVAVRWLPRVAAVGAAIGAAAAALLATALKLDSPLLPLVLAGALVGWVGGRAVLGRAGRTAVGKARLQLERLLDAIAAG